MPAKDPRLYYLIHIRECAIGFLTTPPASNRRGLAFPIHAYDRIAAEVLVYIVRQDIPRYGIRCSAYSESSHLDRRSFSAVAIGRNSVRGWLSSARKPWC